MRIWVLSDLHLELSKAWSFPRPTVRPEFDVLIVAGDLIPRVERGVACLREHVPDQPVLYIAGNHEGYGTDLNRTMQLGRHAAAGTNVFFLEDETMEIGGVQFIAATLWTDFALFGRPDVAMHAAEATMNDYRKIRIRKYTCRLRATDTLSRHIKSRRFIETELQNPFPGPRVIVTHHAPHRSAIVPGHESDPVSAAYVSDLSEIIERYRPDVWIYGHLHRSADVMTGRTRMIANPKGYGPNRPETMHENAAFDPRLTIEI